MYRASAAGSGKGVRPKERTGRAKLSLHTGIGNALEVVESFDCFLPQLRGGTRDRKRKFQKEQECGNGDASS